MCGRERASACVSVGRKGLESRPDLALCPVLGTAAEHPQELAGLQALLLRHLLHIEAHVHEELDHVHLLPRELVPDGGARGVAVRPGTAVDQLDGAALQSHLPVPVALVQAAVPAVQGAGQRRPLHLDVRPVTEKTSAPVAPGGQDPSPPAPPPRRPVTARAKTLTCV